MILYIFAEMESFFESFAHFTHGMAFMFFAIIAAHLYWQKNKNRLIRFLFYEAIFFALIEIKDVIFLINGVKYNNYYNHIFLSIDLWIIPFTILFLIELMSPGWIKTRHAILLTAPSTAFSVFIVLASSDKLFYWTAVYSLVLGIIAFLVFFLATARYNNYVRKNFSYTEGLSVSWVRTIIFTLLLYLILWFFISPLNSWWGDAFYYLVTIGIWSYIYFYTLQHSVIEVPQILFRYRKENAKTEKQKEDDCPYEFAKNLEKVMMENMLFLNPKLQITEVASAIYTNRTYLSNYLNKYLNTTFCDYVNTFRVNMACKLLMENRKQTLERIAEECGFNSLSTFNRSFSRIRNCSPAEFRKHPQSFFCDEKEEAKKPVCGEQ